MKVAYMDRVTRLGANERVCNCMRRFVCNADDAMAVARRGKFRP
jgi:hypothetical protein